MEKFSEIRNSFVDKVHEYNSIEEKIELKRKQIERLQKKTNKNFPYWTEFLLRPLMEEVKKAMPELTFEENEKYVPMGLCSRVSIFPKFKKKTLMLCFIPCDLNNGKMKIETGERTQTFPKGSIAEMNDFGKVSVPVESVAQIVDFLKKQMKGK